MISRPMLDQRRHRDLTPGFVGVAKGAVVGGCQAGKLNLNMKKTIVSIAAIATILTMAGCTTVRESVPATEFSAFLNGKPAKFTGPKDLKADSIIFRADTNGSVTLEIHGLDAKTNPDVITTTGDAQAKITAAQGKAITEAIKEVASGAAAIKP